jgi:formylglycine-generating enzyme required for sulfatase activity
MKNILMKSYVMNDTRVNEMVLVGLGEPSLIYNYQLDRAITKQRMQYNKTYCIKNYFNKTFGSFELVPVEYLGVKFNMITCPISGMTNMKYDEWGIQEIKEPFMLGETEVTQELFEAVMGFNYSKFKKNNKNPVENVTWFDCAEFCNRLSDYFGLKPCYILHDKKTTRKYPLSIEEAKTVFIAGANGFRLPKEWEWQWAALVGTNNEYAGINHKESLKKVAWFKENSEGESHPVSQKKPNEWGFYDMIGNVSEWCDNEDSPNKNSNPWENRVFRGGCWSYQASDLSPLSRYATSPNGRSDVIGFRVARTI